MEGISTSVYKKLKGYWRRRGYVKLNGPRRRKMAQVELGSTPTRRRRTFRIKIKPKLKLRLPNAKKFFVWLRDAYVNMMLKLANSSVISNSGYGGAISDGVYNFGMRPMKEYDEKKIVEIYKSMMMGQLVPHDAAKLSNAAAAAATAAVVRPN